MVHLDKPGPDTGIFNTEEVRPTTKPCLSTSRTIAFPRNHYKKPPHLAAGFRSLHLSHETNARANLVADNITTDSFQITLETWGESTMYAASATWIETKANVKECLFGEFDTQDLADAPENKNSQAQRENSKKIRFRRPFKKDCEVICWLNRLDMAGGESNYRIRAYASDVTREGFIAHIDTWADSVLNGAAMCWIAFPKNKKHVQSGSFNTSDVRSWSNPKPNNSSTIKFQEASFDPDRTPTVLAGLNTLDMAGNADLRIGVDIDEVTNHGFRWHLDTAGDSTLYSAGASWIALGFV